MKKFLSLLLVVAMLAGALCSCQKEEVPSDPSTDTTENENSDYVEKTVLKTEQFDVSDGVPVKLDFMGAEGYLTAVNVSVGGEEKVWEKAYLSPAVHILGKEYSLLLPECESL